MDKVKFLKHPVSSETKKEWNDKGFRIVDIIHQANFEQAASEPEGVPDVNKLTKAEIIENLEQMGLEVPNGANKADLIELYNQQ